MTPVTVGCNTYNRHRPFVISFEVSSASTVRANKQFRDTKMSTATNDQLFTIEDILGKGRGLVAAEKILKGTRILGEEPILKFPGDKEFTKKLQKVIRKKVARLSEDKKQEFLSLTNIHSYNNDAERYVGIILTNGLRTSDKTKAGIFLNASRINHACDSNSQVFWNENTEQITVHALRDIEQGEEIMITYMSSLKTRKDRRKFLQKHYGFNCLCNLCCLPADQRRESDARFERIVRLEYRVNSDAIVAAPLAFLRLFDLQIQLYKQQGREDAGLAVLLFRTSALYLTQSDFARARLLAERAASISKTALGDDNPQAMEHKAFTLHATYRAVEKRSEKWQSNVDEVPQGLTPTQFEDWLWRRSKPNAPGQPTNLRNRTTFPPFEDLPCPEVLHLDYFDLDSAPGRPVRHWLYFGEIVNVGSMFRLQINTRDVNGQIVPLFAYTKLGGGEFDASLLQKGNTVGVLYANFYAFNQTMNGIVIREPNYFKVDILQSSTRTAYELSLLTWCVIS